jgi:hypothetical protein
VEGDVATVVLRELHEHARTELQLYVGWFTFFLTLLLGSMAWSLRASLDRRGRVVAPFPFYCIVALFTVQLVLSIAGTEAVGDDLKRADALSHSLQNQIAQRELPADAAFVATVNPFPQGMHRAMRLMEWTLITNLVFWLVVAAVVYRKRGKKLMGTGE